jgi:virulence-associated protein VagC
MQLKVTEQGVTVPKEFFAGVEKVEIRQENGCLLMVPTQLLQKTRVLELHAGVIQMRDDFDKPLPEEPSLNF